MATAFKGSDAHMQILDGNSYLNQHDVRAMLTRIFGFGGWSEIAVEPTTLVFEDLDTTVGGKGNERPGVSVCYIAHRRLIIYSPHGMEVCRHDGTGTHTATMGIRARGDAHDSAAKSADSAALKRAAINLGDQFGLGLYNNGSTDPLVKRLVLDADSDVEAATE